jgi:UrcA family protein
MLKPISAVAAVLVASALVVPTVSNAAAIDSVRVSFADLNLGTEDGASALERRIAYAAETVCDVGRSFELAQIQASNACHDDALARVQPAFASAVNAAKTGTVTVLDATALIVTAQ